MNPNYRVRVIREFINVADVRNAGNCAVAIAISEATGGSHVSVTTERIRWSEGDEIVFVRTPEKVAQWIRDFDADEPVKPFRFTLSTKTAEVKPRKKRTAVDKAKNRKNTREYIKKGNAATSGKRVTRTYTGA